MDAAWSKDSEGSTTTEEIEEEGGPECGVGGQREDERTPGDVDETNGEEYEGRCEGDYQHGACGCETDIETIEHEGRDSDRRNQHDEPAESRGIGYNLRLIGDK